MPTFKLYTTTYCGYCAAAKELLTKKGLEFQEFPVDNDPELRARISSENGGYSTVPMIFCDEKFIGGYSDLVNMKL